MSEIGDRIGCIDSCNPTVHPALKGRHFGAQKLQVTERNLDHASSGITLGNRRWLSCDLMAMESRMTGRSWDSKFKEIDGAQGNNGGKIEEHLGRRNARTSSGSKDCKLQRKLLSMTMVVVESGWILHGPRAYAGLISISTPFLSRRSSPVKGADGMAHSPSWVDDGGIVGGGMLIGQLLAGEKTAAG